METAMIILAGLLFVPLTTWVFWEIGKALLFAICDAVDRWVR